MKTSRLTAIIFSIILTTGIAYAFSNCMQKYANHPRAIPAQKNNCGICHKNANGSGPQNAFGRAFADAGFMINNMLIADFPDLFLPEEVEEEPTNESTDGQEDNPDTEVEEPTVSDPSDDDNEVSSDPPIIKRIKPKKVKTNTESTVQVRGNNFEEGSMVLIDEAEVNTIFKSNMALKSEFTLEAEGVHKVKVKNPDDSESNEVNLKAKQPKAKKKKK